MISSVVEHLVYTEAVGGSNPSSPIPHREHIMAHRMNEIKPSHFITHEECQKMIDQAIDKHNRTATLISVAIGSVLLFFYAQGLLIVVGLWK